MRKALAFSLIVSGLILLSWLLAGSEIGNENATGQQHQEMLEEYQSSISGEILEPKPEGSNSDKAVLRIPELGKNWVQPIAAGVNEEVLDSGVLGRFPESVAPGAVGNYSLTGHRVTHGEPFRYLTELDKNDNVYLDSGGIRYIYKVRKTFVVDEHEVDVLDSDRRRLITLITCDSYTEHTTDRFVVQGVLTKTRVL